MVFKPLLHCLCCTVSVDILGITVLRGSYDCTLEASLMGFDTLLVSLSAMLRMGQALVCYAMKGLEETDLLLWFQACRVKGLFDRRQLRGKAERGGANSSCVLLAVENIRTCPVGLQGV